MLHCYGAWQMSLFFILGYFLPFKPPNSIKNQNLKKKKTAWRYHHFAHVYGSRDMVSERWMDGQMTEKVTYGGGCPTQKNSIFPTECNFLCDQKIKKRIVNQILLSKLWYIGQICTIPIFINNEIENTIAQFSIWKCGLGILLN